MLNNYLIHFIIGCFLLTVWFVRSYYYNKGFSDAKISMDKIVEQHKYPKPRDFNFDTPQDVIDNEVYNNILLNYIRSIPDGYKAYDLISNVDQVLTKDHPIFKKYVQLKKLRVGFSYRGVVVNKDGDMFEKIWRGAYYTGGVDVDVCHKTHSFSEICYGGWDY